MISHVYDLRGSSSDLSFILPSILKGKKLPKQAQIKTLEPVRTQ